MFELLGSREEGVLSRHPCFVDALGAYARAVRAGRLPATLTLVPVAPAAHAADPPTPARRAAGDPEPVGQP
jgi:hypothetical protein